MKVIDSTNCWSISENEKQMHMSNLNLLARIGVGSGVRQSVIKRAKIKNKNKTKKNPKTLGKSGSKQKINGTHKIVYSF